MASHLKTGDRALVAIILAAAVVGGCWYLVSQSSPAHADGEGLVVVCQSQDGFRRVDELARDAEYTVETPGTGSGADAEGGSNTITISGGTVDVTASNCHNQVCADHEPIARAGEQIVCLPHGLVVEIVEDEADASRLM